MARARDEVVVDQAGRRHEGVDDRGADEFETAGEEVWAEGVALGRVRGTCVRVRRRWTMRAPAWVESEKAEAAAAAAAGARGEGEVSAVMSAVIADGPLPRADRFKPKPGRCAATRNFQR